MSQFLDKMVHALVNGDREAAKTELHQHLNTVASKLINAEPVQNKAPDQPVNESNAFDVYKDGKKIDTVFYSGNDADEVKKSLIDHDGYDSDIVVKKRK